MINEEIENMEYEVIMINKVTGHVQDILQTGITEEAAENICEAWGWNYDDGKRSYWLDYQVRKTA